MELHLPAEFGWRTETISGHVVHWAGTSAPVGPLIEAIAQGVSLEKAIDDVMAVQNGFFAGVLSVGTKTLAYVDHVRSYPLFHGVGKAGQVISNDAHYVADCADDHDFDADAVLEFAMSGYINGRRTIRPSVMQLIPGEALIFDAATGDKHCHQYFRYDPRPTHVSDVAAQIGQLGTIVDAITDRTIEHAAGRPIWVPLSGGLDSRLVLCKLVEKGYDRLHSFSYGTAGNFEARTAKLVAEKLGVPWCFIPTTADKARRYFENGARQDLWRMADGLSSVPSMTDYVALTDMKANGILPDDAFIVNGQSGDYICGAHVPESFYTTTKLTMEALHAYIIDKHYSLWSDLKTPANRRRISARIDAVLAELAREPSGRDDIMAMYEFWEYQERQCKYVVNGQRVYDFLGHDWHLPLWDAEFVRFWQNVDFDGKRDRTLHRSYLAAYNFGGLFGDLGIKPETWSPNMRWIVIPGRIIGLIAGRRAKDAFYRHMSYFGYYNSQLATFGWRHYIKRLPEARGSVSLLVERWIEENDVRLDQQHPFLGHTAARSKDVPI